MNRTYGWRPDIPDKRDLYCRYHPGMVAVLPKAVDMRGDCPAVYDQEDLGSCTANAIGGAHEFEQSRQARLQIRTKNQERRTVCNVFAPSRLFIYWNERAMEGTIHEDAGAYIRDGMKSVSKQGVCPEDGSMKDGAWPYRTERFAAKPPSVCYKHALKHQVLQYRRLDQALIQLKACLASGHPFVFGFTVYDSFESQSVAKAGIVPMPGPGERVLGGHAVLAVGYDDAASWFIVRNSWGEAWGDKGYCYMPYAYLTDGDLAADFWTMTLVEQNS